VRVWDLATGTQLQQLSGHPGGVSALAVATLDGRPIVITGGGDSTVRAWDLSNGNLLLVAGLGARVWGLTFGASTLLVVGTPVGLVALRLASVARLPDRP
jgi:WD40 repeat protein